MSRDSLLAAFREAVDDDPDNVYARFNLATLLAAEGRHQEAVTHLDRVNKAVPGYEGGAGWFNRGLSLAALGRYAEAVASFDRMLKVPYTGRCSHATALLKKAAALDKLGRTQEAKAARAQAGELARREGLEWLLEGNTHFSMGQFVAAVAAYDTSLTHAWKGRPIALLNRGLAKKALAKMAEALADLESALAEVAALSAAEMSHALIAREQPDDTMRALDQMVTNMASALTQYDRAFVRVRMGNLQGAAEDLRGALALAPELSKEARADADFEPLRANPDYADLWPR